MTPRHKRMVLVGFLVLGITGATALALSAFQQNMLFFYSPSQIAAGEAPLGYTFRVGGLVAEHSVKRQPDSLEVRFILTDNLHTIPVVYEGILPDLFREGQGIVARGRLEADQLFRAEEVLAKHDENYMPPEVAEALKTAQDGLVNPHSNRDNGL
jgi:cytochrome c-type biogenesis protein CcmE